MTDGGVLVAQVLHAQGTRVLFTLCGGHISPILVEAKRHDLRVVDVRNEASAVFAADATARLSGSPGVVAVTAGPGLTNSITALKNAQLAQSPVVLLGGAAPTVLKGRGALQDIDQMALLAPHVKWSTSVRRLQDIVPRLEVAFNVARQGVPGPVFVEFPLDVLYPEAIVRESYRVGSESGLRRWYLERHLRRMFEATDRHRPAAPPAPVTWAASDRAVRRAARQLSASRTPVLLVGGQATLRPNAPAAARELADAVTRLGIPTFLSGMARGLLGAQHPRLHRHHRKQALREADTVVLAGVPCDFRLDYGRHISRDARLIGANRNGIELRKNRSPTVPVWCDPAAFLIQLADRIEPGADPWERWNASLGARDAAREREIAAMAAQPTARVNPLTLLQGVERALDPHSVIVLDGGDFAASASYMVHPREPLASLDPGVFGTLGVGAGFALGAKLTRPSAEVWVLYGDGAAGFSLAEFDTFVRHGVPIIAVVGNDAGWTQIARDQIVLLNDDVGTVLRHTDYERVAEGYGGVGLRIETPSQIEPVLAQAKAAAREGRPVLINALIGKTDFRNGSLSF